MTEPNVLHGATDPNVDGPLTREAARALLDKGAELMTAGDFANAFNHYRRVIGFDDPDVTAAALLGAAQARYRMDDEAGAVGTWEAILQLPETPSTLACPPSLPSVPTSRATRVTSEAKEFS